jgi:hypothetical protein
MALEWLIGGGALLAIVGLAVGYLGDEQERGATFRAEMCKRAHEAMLDDQLNRALTEAEQRAFLTAQLRVSIKCAREAGL